MSVDALEFWHFLLVAFCIYGFVGMHLVSFMPRDPKTVFGKVAQFVLGGPMIWAIFIILEISLLFSRESEV